MNHQKLISDTIAKYADFPGIARDMRRILKYAESANRMFLSQFVKDTPPTDDASLAAKDAELDEILAKFADRPSFAPAINRIGVLALRTAYGEDHLSEVRAILDCFNDDPEARQAARQAGNLIIDIVTDAVNEAAQ